MTVTKRRSILDERWIKENESKERKSILDKR